MTVIHKMFTIQTTSLNFFQSSERTSDGLKENDIFSMKKIVGSTLDLSTKAVFSLDKYQLKNMD